MYGYIYKFTIIPTGKFYIGQHKYENKTCLDENYWGSGTLWHKALLKYGKDSINREILEWCNTQEELNLAEEYWIEKFNATNKDLGYNIQTKCYGADSRIPDKENFIEKQREAKIKFWTPEKRLELSSLMKEIMNKPEIKEKLKRQLSEETKQKLRELNIGENNPNWGLKRSNETKAKQRAAALGRPKSETAKMHMKKPKSEIHKQHLSESKLGTKGNHHIELQLYIDDKLVDTYWSVYDAAVALNEYINNTYNIDFGNKYCSSKIYELLSGKETIKFFINRSRKNFITINNIRAIKLRGLDDKTR